MRLHRLLVRVSARPLRPASGCAWVAAAVICTGSLLAGQVGQGTGASSQPRKAGESGSLGMSIAGRVLAPDGRPVPRVFVSVLQPGAIGDRPFRPVNVRLGAMTNERGEYRLDGLYPGEFFVIALPHNPPA